MGAGAGQPLGSGGPDPVADAVLAPAESGVTGSMLLDLPACALEVTRVW